MAKGIGLIGNFRGKVGNMVGYNLKDSNNKQTQGVRVYQPIVKNPKTYAQAEQRAKLAPINATYRALKMIIDRGQEGKAYGNKSRLAWLSDAMKAFNGGWFEKGATITAPALVPLTKGSLYNLLEFDVTESAVAVLDGPLEGDSLNTVGAVSTALMSLDLGLKAGDQITFVAVTSSNTGISCGFTSINIDTESTDALPTGVIVENGTLQYRFNAGTLVAGAIIISREGDGGQHLRTSTSLIANDAYPTTTQGAAAKAAAIKSYMSGGSNTDWAEESLQG